MSQTGYISSLMKKAARREGAWRHAVYPILATPFRPGSESVDTDALRASVNFMARAGCTGVTVCGVLGEANRILDSERADIIRATVEAAAPFDLQVCVGTSHPGTYATAQLSMMAQELGAASVMVTPSREAAPLSQGKLVEYFGRVGDAIEIDMVLQDHPSSTQVHMDIDTVATICREVPQIRAIKLESLPTPPRAAALRELLDAHPATSERVAILVGLGALYSFFDLETGAVDGFMTGWAFPELLMAMLAAQERDDLDLAFDLYRKWLPLIVFEQQPGVAVRKEILGLRGLMGEGVVRHPGGAISQAQQEAVRRVVGRVVGASTDVTRPLGEWR